MAGNQQHGATVLPNEFRRRIVVVYSALLVASVTFVIWMEPKLLQFKPLSLADLIAALAPLVLVAAFIERALEIFISGIRGEQQGRLKTEVDVLPSGAELIAKMQDLTEWTHRTNRIAFVCGAALGVVASALGIRALELFLDSDVVAGLKSWQLSLLHSFDVVLTGAVLGGGADGLHKITSAMTHFLEKIKS